MTRMQRAFELHLDATWPGWRQIDRDWLPAQRMLEMRREAFEAGWRAREHTERTSYVRVRPGRRVS